MLVAGAAFGHIAPFVPITIVSASGYSGSITSLSENLSGAVWFNPGNGTVTRIEFPVGGNSFSGSTRNQTSTWISLYDNAIGWNSGMLGEYLLDEKSRTRVTAGMSVGSYTYDGSRGSASATAAGWSPGKMDFDDVEVDAFDLFVGVDGVVWKQRAHTLIPSVG